MTLDPDQQETLYQINQIRIVLDDAESCSAGLNWLSKCSFFDATNASNASEIYLCVDRR